jgi:hypothetical protein
MAIHRNGTRKPGTKRTQRITRKNMKGGWWSSSKVAPSPNVSPNTRKIESQFDLFIDKFNGSIADEIGQTDMLTYYNETQEYNTESDTDIKYPYMGKNLIITYRESEEYSLKHDFSVCDIEPLCEYIAEKRLGSIQNYPVKEKLEHGALYIIKTILEKIGTDVTTDSVKRFMLQYIWNDTPLVKQKLDENVRKFNEIRYTGGNNEMKKKFRSLIQKYQAILNCMLCVRVLIKKKFNDVGYVSHELNDVFGGVDASLFNGPTLKKEVPQMSMKAQPKSFVRKCIDGVCSILGIKR